MKAESKMAVLIAEHILVEQAVDINHILVRGEGALALLSRTKHDSMSREQGKLNSSSAVEVWGPKFLKFSLIRKIFVVGLSWKNIITGSWQNDNEREWHDLNSLDIDDA